MYYLEITWMDKNGKHFTSAEMSEERDQRAYFTEMTRNGSLWDVQFKTVREEW